MIDIKDVKSVLAANATSVCHKLFPSGKVESGCFKIGDVHGEAGRSLSVQLHGDTAGAWTDFESGKFGDLLDLICESQSLDLKGAMDWATQQYGIRTQAPTQKIKAAGKKKYNTPKPPKRVNSETLHEFLQGRGFKEVGELIARWQIYETSEISRGKDLIFQFFDANEKLVYLKSKPMDYDGNPTTVNKDLKPILYGWHMIPEHARDVWIVEGELDAIAGRQLGFPMLSLPSGSNNMKWIEHEMPYLARFESIAICTDMDEAGDRAADTLLKRLGDRCFRVQIPVKDINDLLKEHGYDKAKLLLAQAYDSAKYQDPEQLRNVIEFRDDVDEYFDNQDAEKRGLKTGFAKIDEHDFRFGKGELIGCTGINGHGKSMFVNQLIANLMRQDEKCLIASMEMAPKLTLARTLKQLCGTGNPDKQHRDKALDWLADNLWLFVDNLTPKPDELLKVFKYAYQRYGITTFVIDSLTNMVGQMDYEKQQRFVEQLVEFKLAYNTTVFLVTHSRKGESEAFAPGKFDVKGSGSITDLADSFLSVWKNKPKIEHMENAYILNETADPDISSQWDFYLEVLKNRNGMWEGKVGFMFDKESCQYLETTTATPKAYIDNPNKETPF